MGPALIVIAVLLAAGATQVEAQSRCPDAMSLSACIQARYSGFFPDSVSEAVAKKATSEAAVTPSSIQDFLPRLAAAATTSGVDANAAKLGLVANTPLNDGALFDLGARLQTSVQVNNPELYSRTLEALPEERRPAVKERLSGDLDELDDVQLVFTLSADNRRWGRTGRFHNDVLGVLATEVTNLLSPPLKLASAALLGELAGAADVSRPECQVTGGPELPMGCIRADRREALEAKISAFAAQVEAFARASLRLSRELEVSRLADLVNNQPQVSASVDWRPRDVLTGPQSLTFRIRGETGLANVNGLRRFCNRERRDEEAVQRRRLPLRPVTSDCYRRYIRDGGNVRSSMRRGDRIWLSVDATRQREYDAPLLPEDLATLHLNGKWSFDGSAGYGFYPAAAGSTDPQRTRVDLSARHVWNREATLRPERRWVLTANVTHRVMDKLALITGVQWANKPEFLDSDVRATGINFGARYKFEQGK